VYYPVKGGIFGRKVGYSRAVDGVSFSVEGGQNFGLVGESGSGKSTTGRAILGLEKIHGGSIIFDGENITKYVGKNRSDYRKNVQMIFQDSAAALNPRKRVLDIIAEPLRNFEKLSRTEEKKRVSELLEIVALPQDSVFKYPFEFSGGQRQRINIARAVALKPKLIVADEPISALDYDVREQILRYLTDIQAQMKIAFLFISHDLQIVRKMCGKIAVMQGSQIVETGTTDEVFTNPQHEFTRRLIECTRP
jgi:peptide/nickel transport system ATP-binding protein